MENLAGSLLDQLVQLVVKVDHQKKRAFFGADTVEKAVNSAPSLFSWHTRNPQFDITIGGDLVCCCITTAPSTVLDLDGVRRPATVEDAMNISRITK